MLRKAEKKDFGVYKELYLDEEFKYQWMYYTPGTVDLDETETVSEDDIFSDFINEFRNYNLEKFEADLKNCQIFMIENDGKILGFIQTFYCGRGSYKLCYWGMFHDDPSVKRVVINELKTKLPRLKRIFVCTGHEPARKFFTSVGFVPTSRLFLELKV